MSVEGIESEAIQPSETQNIDLYERNQPNWNGRHVNKSQLQNLSSFRNMIFSKTEAEPLRYSYNDAEIITCGETVDGEVSARGSIDTEGNKDVEVEIEVSSKDGNISGSVSGGITQDKGGHTEGRVEVEGIWYF